MGGRIKVDFEPAGEPSVEGERFLWWGFNSE